MTQLPYAPLVLGELNARVQDAKSALAYSAAYALRGGRQLQPGDLDILRRRVAELDDWQAAARARLT